MEGVPLGKGLGRHLGFATVGTPVWGCERYFDRFMFLWTSPSTPQYPVQRCLKLGSEQPQLLASEAGPKGSDEKECRKCGVWLNLENDPGDWRNGGGVQSGTRTEALELLRPSRVRDKLSSETQNPDLRFCFRPPKYA